jgi:hypothetical protein
MTVVQTPEILQIINAAIINIVSIIEVFGLMAFQMLVILFVIWMIYEIGRAFYELITLPA